VPDEHLQRLAVLYGIKLDYTDMDNRTRAASPDALFACLKALGAPLNSMQDVPAAIREKTLNYWKRPLEPVIVVWDNLPLMFDLHLPAGQLPSRIAATLFQEKGEITDFEWQLDRLPVAESSVVEGVKYVSLRLSSTEGLPCGYHRLRVDLPGLQAESLVISTPLKAYASLNGLKHIWGVFSPLYALHSKRSWGAGDFTDLASFMEWIAASGGNLLGSLPLLPSFFDKESGPGPYLPASRLFWNEFYLDVEKAAGLLDCSPVQGLVSGPAFQKKLNFLRDLHTIDYETQLALKRAVLEELCECFFRDKPAVFGSFIEFTGNHPDLESYARFRAAGEAAGIDWMKWPEICPETPAYAEKNKLYHMFVQWLASGQMEQLSEISADKKMILYLDMPVGVHARSYDVWKERKSFATLACGGAPPDPIFTSGQNWGFPPLHPEEIRNSGYRYYISSIRHQLKHAGMLRIDHMMNLHRLFWIPQGIDNSQGLYVGYHPEEFYAILTLESWRHKSIIVGEDLGTVPPEVRPMMNEHRIFRLFIGQYDLINDGQIGPIPSQSVAGLNTHDMFPFSSFWDESDIAERQKLGLVSEKRAFFELEQRRSVKRSLISALQYRGLDNEISQDTGATLKAVLELLARSSAFALLVNLEDLWLETQPQNVPGTLRSQNWSRKTRYSLEQLPELSDLVSLLQRIDRERKALAWPVTSI